MCRFPDRCGRDLDPDHSGGDLHFHLRPRHLRPRLGPVLADLAGHRNLADRVLRDVAGRTAFRHVGHADDGSAAAHLFRHARLFRARGDACRIVLDFDLVPDAAGADKELGL